MMGRFQTISGTVSLRLTGADIAGSLRKLSDAGVLLRHIRYMDDLNVSFTVSEKDLKTLQKLCERTGDRVVTIRRMGISRYLKRFLRRPVLVLCMLLLTAGMTFIPTRIFFVEVEGNEKLPARLILEAAADSGIGFGASRREVRSERMKNSLLSALPQLQWAGVNTYGCRAVITVRERAEEEACREDQTPSSIVALRDGIVISCTTTRGTQLCAVGRAVREGQVLISGYEDHGLTIHMTRAEGEILAQTSRQLSVITPETSLRRGHIGEMEVRYSLCIGKKRINFYKGSGICEGRCVKMYSEYVLTLPGGFSLPVKLVRETVSDTDVEAAAVDEAAASALLSDFTSAYLKQQMVAGQILERREKISRKPGILQLEGEYACTEMIGRRRQEQIGEHNGKTD